MNKPHKTHRSMKKTMCLLAALCLTAAVFGQATKQHAGKVAEKRTVSEFSGIEASGVSNITVSHGKTQSLTITATAAVFGQATEQDAGKVTEKRTVPEFSGIEASGIFKITVTRGKTQSLTITAPEETMPYIEAEVVNGVLELSIEGTHSFRQTKSPEVHITMKNLRFVDLSGACSLESSHTFEPDNFECELSGAASLQLGLKTRAINLDITGASRVELTATAQKAELDVSGASNLNLDLQLHAVFLDVSGSSNIRLRGAANKAVFDVSGASKIEAFDFPVKQVEADLSGSSKMQLHAVDELSVDVSGISTVSYKGKPHIKAIDTSGLSKVRQVD
jgi:hypothetical protein